VLAGLPITPDVRRLFQVDMAKPAAHARRSYESAAARQPGGAS
jgi:hypothetical protein